MRKIKLVRPFRSYLRGDVVEVPTGQAIEMIRSGIAIAETQQELLEPASLEPEARTADATPKKRSRRT